MFRQGWDWSSSSITITTLLLLSSGWWKFGFECPYFTPGLHVYRLIQLFHIRPTLPISHHKYNGCLNMVEIGIQALKWSLQPTFELWWVVKIWVWVPYILHLDGVCLDWVYNFTSSQPFQLLIISMMNGWGRLRLVYGLYNGHHNMFLRCRWAQSRLCICT